MSKIIVIISNNFSDRRTIYDTLDRVVDELGVFRIRVMSFLKNTYVFEWASSRGVSVTEHLDNDKVISKVSKLLLFCNGTSDIMTSIANISLKKSIPITTVHYKPLTINRNKKLSFGTASYEGCIITIDNLYREWISNRQLDFPFRLGEIMLKGYDRVKLLQYIEDKFHLVYHPRGEYFYKQKYKIYSVNNNVHGYVYCGRGSALGNPYPLPRYSRDGSCELYDIFLREKLMSRDTPDQKMSDELRHIWKLWQKQDVFLKCFCYDGLHHKGKRCHTFSLKHFLLWHMPVST